MYLKLTTSWYKYQKFNEIPSQKKSDRQYFFLFRKCGFKNFTYEKNLLFVNLEIIASNKLDLCGFEKHLKRLLKFQHFFVINETLSNQVKLKTFTQKL